MAVKLQFLELAKKISFEIFSDLGLLRRKRNEIVHPRKRKDESMEAIADPEVCGIAFSLLQKFIEDEFRLIIELNTSYSHTLVFDR